MWPATFFLRGPWPSDRLLQIMARPSDLPDRPGAEPSTDKAETAPSFAHPSAPIIYALFRVARKGRSTVAAMLQPLGLYPGQEVLLLYLGEQGALSQGQLTNALGLDHSTVAKMVRRMQVARLVERRRSASDRRVTLVSLTEEGERACLAVRDVWARLEQIVTAPLSPRDRTHFLRLLVAAETVFDEHS